MFQSLPLLICGQLSVVKFRFRRRLCLLQRLQRVFSSLALSVKPPHSLPFSGSECFCSRSLESSPTVESVFFAIDHREGVSASGGGDGTLCEKKTNDQLLAVCVADLATPGRPT